MSADVLVQSNTRVCVMLYYEMPQSSYIGAHRKFGKNLNEMLNKALPT